MFNFFDLHAFSWFATATMEATRFTCGYQKKNNYVLSNNKKYLIFIYMAWFSFISIKFKCLRILQSAPPHRVALSQIHSKGFVAQWPFKQPGSGSHLSHWVPFQPISHAHWLGPMQRPCFPHPEILSK